MFLPKNHSKHKKIYFIKDISITNTEKLKSPSCYFLSCPPPLGFHNYERSHDFDEDMLKTQLQIHGNNCNFKIKIVFTFNISLWLKFQIMWSIKVVKISLKFLHAGAILLHRTKMANLPHIGISKIVQLFWEGHKN